MGRIKSDMGHNLSGALRNADDNFLQARQSCDWKFPNLWSENTSDAIKLVEMINMDHFFSCEQ